MILLSILLFKFIKTNVTYLSRHLVIFWKLCLLIFFPCHRPPPIITWTKDGEEIKDDQEDFLLPSEHFGRLLIIPQVEEEHQGTYTCTASSTDGSFNHASKATFLTVQGLFAAFFIIKRFYEKTQLNFRFWDENSVRIKTFMRLSVLNFNFLLPFNVHRFRPFLARLELFSALQ